VDGAEGRLYTVDGSGNRCEVLDIVKAVSDDPASILVVVSAINAVVFVLMLASNPASCFENVLP
jgi:hypothetical protein